MFESYNEDRLKRSMQYGSIYAINDDMMESKRKGPLKSRISGFNYQNSRGMGAEAIGIGRALSVESSVHQLDMVAPGNLNFRGTLY